MLPRIPSSHSEDWEFACDNTRTCRAAGYQDEALGPSASVLLTRRAGPDQLVLATRQLADNGDAEAQPDIVHMFVEDRALGSVTLTGKDAGQSSRQQTAALLHTLDQDRAIAWRAGASTWTISASGSTAVLLKMDASQGRLGTPGALVRKGSKPEATVLPALSLPVIHAVTPAAATAAVALSADERAGLLAALRQASADDLCEALYAESDHALLAYPLSRDRMLVSTTCWRAAYDTANGFWIAKRKPPYAPRLVTHEASD